MFEPNLMDYGFLRKEQLKDLEYLRKKKYFYRYLQIHYHYEHNIKNKTDFSDTILKIFTV